MPFIDLAFRLKPVGQVVSVFDRVDAKVHALAGQFALPSSLARQYGELTRSFFESLIYSFGWLRLTLSSGSSKRKTIATQSPEFGVAIAGGLDAGEKLMSRMGAAVMMAFGIVLMLRHRHPRSRSFANV